RHVLAFCRFEGGRAAGGMRRAPPATVIRRGPVPLRRGVPFPGSPDGVEEEGEEEPVALLDGSFARLWSPRVTFDHSLFHSILGTAVGAQNSAVEVRDSVFSESRNGILAAGGTLEVQRSVFRKLYADGLHVLLAKEGSKIEGCSLREVLGTGISIEGGNA